MNKFILGFVILALGVVVGWVYLGGKAPVPSGNNLNPTPAETSEASPAPTAMEEPAATPSGERMVVTYTDTGFSPSSVTVVQGTTVTFTNESNKAMWVASAVHPTHQLLPGFDQLKSVLKGGIYEYTFTKVGTWKYHNHMAPGDTGTIVVQ